MPRCRSRRRSRGTAQRLDGARPVEVAASDDDGVVVIKLVVWPEVALFRHRLVVLLDGGMCFLASTLAATNRSLGSVRIGEWLIGAINQAAVITAPSKRQTTLVELALPTLSVLHRSVVLIASRSEVSGARHRWRE